MKRKKFLNDFINTILRSSELRSSQDLLEFLKDDNNESFKNYKKNQKIEANTSKIPEIVNFNGETICDISQDNALYDCIYDYLDLSENLEKQLKESTSLLINSTNSLSNSIKEFSEQLAELQKNQDVIPNNYKNAEFCELSHICMERWSIYEEVNTNIYESDLKLHFSYKIKEKSVLKDLIKERKRHLNNYNKIQKNSKNGAEIEHFKNIYGHFNYKIKDEIEKAIGNNIIKDIEHFSNLSINEKMKFESISNVWENASEAFNKSF